MTPEIFFDKFLYQVYRWYEEEGIRSRYQFNVIDDDGYEIARVTSKELYKSDDDFKCLSTLLTWMLEDVRSHNGQS